MRLFAGDDVLIRVVEVVVTDHARSRLVTLDERDTVGGDRGQQRSEFVLLHVFITPVFPCSSCRSASTESRSGALQRSARRTPCRPHTSPPRCGAGPPRSLAGFWRRSV